MREYLGDYHDISWNTIRKMNKWLDKSTKNNNKKWSLENGRLYLVDKPRLEHTKLSMSDHRIINSQLSKYGCNIEDVGK